MLTPITREIMLELHCHTTCSDGTLTPTQLVEAAIAAGVQALAITDHDTTAGWDEAIAAAQPHGLEIVPGLELSTVHNGRSLHVLGFYPDRDKLAAPLQERLEGRKRRAVAIVEKLAALGYPVPLPELADNMAPGRPHIAMAMVQAGYVNTPQEAFDRFLGDLKPAYVEHEKFPTVDGIRLLLECGAVPVWAHPYLFRGGTVETVLPELVAAGLQGLEVFHPTHSPSETRRLQELCQHYDLLMTGGSDYHGKSSDGRILNSLRVPLDLLAAVRSRAGTLAG
ncbi:MAG: PHP domain-containing protein [Synechococcales bacterium]|nr:PHP domain-containing protein [Synechococcales bacterium]